MNVILGDGFNSVPATVVVRVLPVNDVPVINGLVSPLSFDENTTLTLSLAQFEIDPDNASDELVLAIVEDDVMGYSVDGLTITPLPAFSGTLTVAVTVSDSELTSAPFTFTVTVLDVNDPPEIIGQREIQIDEDTSYQVRAEDFEAIDADHDFPTHHSVTLLPGDNYTVDGRPTGSRVHPAQDFAGELTVFGLLTDAGGASAAFELLVTVREVNDAPVVNPLHPPFQMEEDGGSSSHGRPRRHRRGYLGFPDGFTLTFLPVPEPYLYTLSKATRSRLFPSAIRRRVRRSGHGTDRRGGTSAVANIRVIVHPVDDAPVLSLLADIASLEDEVVGPVAFTVGDVDTALAEVLVTATSDNQALVPEREHRDCWRWSDPHLHHHARAGSAQALPSSRCRSPTATQPLPAPSASMSPPQRRADHRDHCRPDHRRGPVDRGLSFTVGDVDTPVASLVLLSATSSNPSLVAASGIVFAGTGAQRTVRVTPLAHQSGTTSSSP